MRCAPQCLLRSARTAGAIVFLVSATKASGNTTRTVQGLGGWSGTKTPIASHEPVPRQDRILRGSMVGALSNTQTLVIMTLFRHRTMSKLRCNTSMPQVHDTSHQGIISDSLAITAVCIVQPCPSSPRHRIYWIQRLVASCAVCQRSRSDLYTPRLRLRSIVPSMLNTRQCSRRVSPGSPQEPGCTRSASLFTRSINDLIEYHHNSAPVKPATSCADYRYVQAG